MTLSPQEQKMIARLRKNRRFTRLTNAFSKKFENHEAAAVASKVREVSDIVALLNQKGVEAAA